MILQALVRRYDALAAAGDISATGWSIAKVTFALELAPDGTLINLLNLKQVPEGGKKELPVPKTVPEQVKKTSGVAANFLCDNSAYMLGVDGKGKPERTQKCFAAAQELHHAVLDGVDSEAAQAVLHFFDTWQPSEAETNAFLVPQMDEIKGGANFIFQVTGSNVQDDPAVRQAWETYSAKKSDDAVVMRCLVTGEEAPIARLHPNIKGINGAQSSGASLVSYNALAFESYNHEQGLNAPVSEAAAFKYGTALNYMIADRAHVQRIADTTMVYWAEEPQSLYQDIWASSLCDNNIDMSDLDSTLHELKSGGCIHGVPLKYDNPFYVLGLAPNAARLSVRFFLQGEFGKMLENLNAHNKRLEIVQPYGGKDRLPLWHLLNETADQNAKTKTPPPPMVSAVLRAILLGGDYPMSLFENVMLRVRTEHAVNWKKAAILKAYFLQNQGIKVPKEVLQVELNESSAYTPYVLGRLFAVLEKVQTTATPGIKATIRDKYFTSASATPSVIFPLLLSLSQHHQRKLSEGSKIYYDKLISKLENQIHATLPERQTLQEQGAFYLGYYHERQALFTKKAEDSSENNSSNEEEDK